MQRSARGQDCHLHGLGGSGVCVGGGGSVSAEVKEEKVVSRISPVNSSSQTSQVWYGLCWFDPFHNLIHSCTLCMFNFILRNLYAALGQLESRETGLPSFIALVSLCL